MSQPDLFAAPAAARCGTCVNRNAQFVEQPTGYCTPAGERRAANARACDQWFGMEQLILATTLKRKPA